MLHNVDYYLLKNTFKGKLRKQIIFLYFFPTVIVLPVYKISSLKITPPKTPNSGQFSYPLPNIVSFLFEKKSTRVLV
jgi:hypothetical protein